MYLATRTPPTAEQVKEARESRHIPAWQAAELVEVHLRTWMRYERGEAPMKRALFDLFLSRADDPAFEVKRFKKKPRAKEQELTSVGASLESSYSIK